MNTEYRIQESGATDCTDYIRDAGTFNAANSEF